MGVRFYDDALLEKIRNWIPSTEITLTGVNETRRLFETILDKTDDRNIKLPLIALSRPRGYTILNRNKRPVSYTGSTFQSTLSKSAKVNIVPIGIAYQLDIYTKYSDEADEFARNFIFNIINYPKLTINVPYEDLGIKHDANIRITSDIDDNSDIPERLIPGQFTRLTLGINIDDAYLFDVRVKDNISIKEISIIPEKNPPELILDIN